MSNKSDFRIGYSEDIDFSPDILSYSDPNVYIKTRGQIVVEDYYNHLKEQKDQNLKRAMAESSDIIVEPSTGEEELLVDMIVGHVDHPNKITVEQLDISRSVIRLPKNFPIMSKEARVKVLAIIEKLKRSITLTKNIAEEKSETITLSDKDKEEMGIPINDNVFIEQVEPIKGAEEIDLSDRDLDIDKILKDKPKKSKKAPLLLGGAAILVGYFLLKD